MLCGTLALDEELDEVEGVAVVRLAEETAWDEEAFGDLFGRLAEDGRPRLLLDFSFVERLSSAEFAALLRLRRQVEAAGGRLVLCGLKAGLTGFFALTCLDRLFDIYPDEDDALTSLLAPRPLLGLAGARAYSG
jgi:anti-anti-sigma factor